MLPETVTAVEPEHPIPLELRVHGVGGPQAVKMLGEVSEQDIVTMPSFPVEAGNGQTRLPENVETRFAQRLTGDRTEAYEWGGLTVGSARKGLWIIYLPFTLINAGGWAHAADHPSDPKQRPRATRRAARASIRLHVGLTHVAAYLATLTYVAWISYLILQLVARDWVVHVQKQEEAEGVMADVILLWTPRVAPAICILVVLGLLLCPVRKGRFEEVQGADSGADPGAPWPCVPSLADPAFFTHAKSHDFRLGTHMWVAFVGLAAALLQFMVGWNRLGIVLLTLAAVQVVVLALLCLVDICGRWWRLPSEVFADRLITDPHLHDSASRLPAGATFVTIGTALAHSMFAGMAMTLSPLLARWPKDSGKDGDKDRLPMGAELGATDVLAWAVVLFVVLALVVLMTSPRAEPEENLAGTSTQGPVVRLTRQASRLALAALLAIIIPVACYIVLNVRGAFDGKVTCDGLRVACWYDGYQVKDGAVAKRLGGLLLLLLPGAIYGALWRQHETGFGRVVGNIWDVLTFWPRRFHPYAAPCSSERAVPELRARIVHINGKLSDTKGGGLVVVAHSQGTVLAATAIASLPEEEPVPSLVTFGSPLGTLYSPTWPAYIPPLLAEVRQRVNRRHPTRPWVNFWRTTDPVGAGVAGAKNEHLKEPQAPAVNALRSIRKLRPLERPPRWGTVSGHSHYLAEPAVQGAIRERKGRRGA